MPMLSDTEKLFEKAERLALVLEGTRLGMWDWNPRTNEVHFDERWAQMLGYDISEIEQHLRSWESRVHPDDLASCYADISRHIAGETAFYENVHRMRHKDGSWHYILDRGKVVARDESGNPIRFTGTHTDITAQKLAEAQAIAANKAKDIFLANMSHEIRTPLHGILGLTHVLMNTELSEEQKKLLEIIHTSGESLLTVLNDILDLSRLEAGALEISATATDLYALLESQILLFDERAIIRKNQIRLDIEKDVPRIVFVDSGRLRQITGNLISNAIKFTESGHINVSVSVSGFHNGAAELQFRVTDTGIGIPADRRQDIFERFRQAEESTSRVYGGTGLGLPISRELARLMGGDLVLVDSSDSGSTFLLSLVLPVIEFRQPVAQKPDARNYEGLHLLIVDDNETNLIIAERLFGMLGITTSLAASGQEALEIAASRRFDAVFLDLHMPEMDGRETLRRLRILPGQANADVVAFTADAFESTRQECLDAGFDDVLTKPFNKDDLHNILHRIRIRKSALPAFSG